MKRREAERPVYDLTNGLKRQRSRLDEDEGDPSSLKQMSYVNSDGDATTSYLENIAAVLCPFCGRASTFLVCIRSIFLALLLTAVKVNPSLHALVSTKCYCS